MKVKTGLLSFMMILLFSGIAFAGDPMVDTSYVHPVR